MRHPISRSQISENALKVLYRLKDAGHASLLVGGCVRDLMLGREPKDFDVVTDARPEKIKRLFRNARLIGRRFRLAHVHFGREIVEVTTFRGLPRTAQEGFEEENGPVAAAASVSQKSGTARFADQNVFGTQEEDALRRDFTVNALYYNIHDDTVMDFVGGVDDLKAGILRIIGNPATRYHEDPVRMLRAIRFSAKLGFRIEPKTAEPICSHAPLLATVPSARLYEEVLKLFHGGYALETFELLRHYGLFKALFPLTEESLEKEEQGFPITLVPRALANTDERVIQGKPVTPAFLFAVLLWEPARLRAGAWMARSVPMQEAVARAAQEVLHAQMRCVAMPHRVSSPIREIWMLQSRFERRSGKRAYRLLENKRFRAAYDFLLLRAESGEADPALADWWTRFQAASDKDRRAMVATLAPGAGHKRQRREPRTSDIS